MKQGKKLMDIDPYIGNTQRPQQYHGHHKREFEDAQ
jgi:hypothetical protein